MISNVVICIPCHNGAKWVSDAIESAINQSHPASEIIVVNDASSDNTKTILDSFGNRITVLNGHGRGGCAARNLAWQHSQSPWVQFLDHDDYLLVHKIRSNLNAAKISNADAIYSPVIEEATALGKRHVTEYYDTEDHALRWIRWKLCQTGGLLWSRKALEHLGGWNEKMPHCQDNEICARALQQGLKFHFDPAPNTVYRIHSENTVSRRQPVSVVKTKTSLQVKFLLDLEATRQATPAHRRAVAQALFENARMIARTDIAGAKKFLNQYSAVIRPSVSGPAAPKSYRTVYTLLGFSKTEWLAKVLRRPSRSFKKETAPKSSPICLI